MLVITMEMLNMCVLKGAAVVGRGFFKSPTSYRLLVMEFLGDIGKSEDKIHRNTKEMVPHVTEIQMLHRSSQQCCLLMLN